MIDGNRIKVFRGLERKQDIPAVAPTVDLNLDDKPVDNSQLDMLSTLNNRRICE